MTKYLRWYRYVEGNHRGNEHSHDAIRMNGGYGTTLPDPHQAKQLCLELADASSHRATHPLGRADVVDLATVDALLLYLFKQRDRVCAARSRSASVLVGSYQGNSLT